jgi:hypothetical protein
MSYELKVTCIIYVPGFIAAIILLLRRMLTLRSASRHLSPGLLYCNNSVEQSISGKFKRSQQENVFPFSFINPVNKITVKRHTANITIPPITFIYTGSL